MDPIFVIEHCWQKKGYGNCAAVAVIKAAIIEYGIGNVFQLTEDHEMYRIRLRNGRVINVMKDLMPYIVKRTGIGFSKKIDEPLMPQLAILKKYVNICFAIMAGYLVKFGYYDKDEDKHYKYTLKEAIKELAKTGFYADKVHLLLGLKLVKKKGGKLKRKQLANLKSHKAVILFNDYHTVVSSQGYFDRYSIPCLIGKKKPTFEKEPMTHWLAFK